MRLQNTLHSDDTDRQWHECQVALCNENDVPDQQVHVHMTACRTTSATVAIETQTCMRINGGMLSNEVMHTTVILDCSKPLQSTPHAPQVEEVDTTQAAECFQQTLLTHDINRRG